MRLSKTVPGVVVGSIVAAAALFAAYAANVNSYTIPYQGVLEKDGVPMDGTVGLRFELFDDADPMNTAPVWSEEHLSTDVVVVSGGRFQVVLGNITGLTEADLRRPNTYLSITVLEVDMNGAPTGTESPLIGRQLLGSVPYAWGGAPGQGFTIDGALSLGTALTCTDCVDNADIADAAVDSADIADGTVAEVDLGADAVTSAKILDGTVTGADILDSAITGADILNGSIARGDIANGAVNSTKTSGTNATVSYARGGCACGNNPGSLIFTNGLLTGHVASTCTGCGGGPCFIAGTQVFLADGTARDIESIEVGDVLLGAGGSHNRVLALDLHTVGTRKLYGINHGEPFVTPGHPFMSTDGWKSMEPHRTAEVTDLPVTQLRVGDTLITHAGRVEVRSISSARADATKPVYNFITDGTRSYYADGFLVRAYNDVERARVLADSGAGR